VGFVNVTLPSLPVDDTLRVGLNGPSGTFVTIVIEDGTER
jgi:hypothetical protein